MCCYNGDFIICSNCIEGDTQLICRCFSMVIAETILSMKHLCWYTHLMLFYCSLSMFLHLEIYMNKMTRKLSYLVKAVYQEM